MPKMTSSQFGSWKRIFTATENRKFSWNEMREKGHIYKSYAIVSNK